MKQELNKYLKKNPSANLRMTEKSCETESLQKLLRGLTRNHKKVVLGKKENRFYV